MMTIAALLDGKGHEVVHVHSGATVLEAAQLLAERRIGCVPVIDQDDVIGIVSERDIVRVLGRAGPEVLSQSVSSMMTSPALTIPPDLPVMSALSMMTQRRIRHLPVMDRGQMVGFVSIGDLVKYRIDRIEAEAAAMREYIQSA